MPKILGSGSRPRLVTLSVALAVVAVACGGSADTTVADAADTTPATSSTEVANEPEAAEEVAESSEEDTASGDAEAAVENLFPDIDVVDVVDGATVNLAAELGGGDLPVLLWFWAPH